MTILYSPLAEHNFGPFGNIFFVIDLFEPESKTLFNVLFSSLCLQICIFYFGITKYYIYYQRARKTEIQIESSKQNKANHRQSLIASDG